jgi:hypothetical protein
VQSGGNLKTATSYQKTSCVPLFDTATIYRIQIMFHRVEQCPGISLAFCGQFASAKRDRQWWVFRRNTLLGMVVNRGQ